MATPPVFTAGSVLTAAQMNAVGLWRVTGCTVTSAGGTAATASNGVITVGSGNTSVTISNAFSDFNNYKIIYSGGTASGTVGISFKLGASATGYYYSLNYSPYNNTPTSLGATNQANFLYAGTASTNGTSLNLDVLGPNIASRYTMMNAVWYGINEAGHSVCTHQVAASYTDFTIAPHSGSLTGGTIRVYGYNS